MPLKLNDQHLETVPERIRALRLTIPRGYGLTLDEVGEKCFCTRQHAHQICFRLQWLRKNLNEKTGKTLLLLVHPEDLPARPKEPLYGTPQPRKPKAARR